MLITKYLKYNILVVPGKKIFKLFHTLKTFINTFKKRNKLNTNDNFAIFNIC